MQTTYHRNIKETLLTICNEIKDRPELIELYDAHYPNTHWVKIIDFNALHENKIFRAAHLDTYVKLRLIEQHLHKLLVVQDQDLSSTSLVSSIDGEPLAGLTFKLHDRNYKECEYKTRIKHYHDLIEEAEQQLIAMQTIDSMHKERHGFWNIASEENNHRNYTFDEVLMHIDTFSASLLAKFKAQLSVVEAINKIKEFVGGTTELNSGFTYRKTSDSLVTLFVSSIKPKSVVATCIIPIAIDFYVNNDSKDSLYGYQYHIGIVEQRAIDSQ